MGARRGSPLWVDMGTAAEQYEGAFLTRRLAVSRRSQMKALMNSSTIVSLRKSKNVEAH